MSDQLLNIAFVEEVKKHDVLYNYKLPGYSRKDITEKAWQEVAAKVNLTAAECKEKWRNLRTVFIRKIKPLPIGSVKKKKAYYLAETMQFCLPFVRTMALPSSGNLLPSPQNDTPIDVCVKAETFDDDTTSPRESAGEALPQAFDLAESLEIKVEPDHPDLPSPPSSSMRAEERLAEMNESEVDAERYVTEYFKAKKARLETPTNMEATSSQSIDRKEALKMFLLSLLPELEELSDSQIKLFKRRVFNIIDEISTL